MKKRNYDELKETFQKKGLTVVSQRLGMSYREGGFIAVLTPDLGDDLQDLKDVEIHLSNDLCGFESTGYQDRGRYFDLYLVKAGGRLSSISKADYDNLSEDDRLLIGKEGYFGDISKITRPEFQEAESFFSDWEVI